MELPVTVVADGTENGLGFSLTWNPAQLTFESATKGTNASPATLTPNDVKASEGKFGAVLTWPTGTTMSAGTRQILRVTFRLAAGASGDLAVTFGDDPVMREVSDAAAGELPVAQWAAGVVSVTTGIESDVAPRPNGSGTGSITTTDAVQVCRFVAGLDTAAPGSEFQRGDTAPRSTFGDGRMTTSDCVQAQRDAAGLDAVRAAAGPTTPVTADARTASDGARVVAATNTAIAPGTSGTVAITLTGDGAENAAGFSVTFDPAHLTFVSATAGSGAAGASLVVNDTQHANGRLGLLLSLPAGLAWPAGTREIVVVTFAAAATSDGLTTVGFGDVPVFRELASVTAGVLETTFTAGTVTTATRELAVADTTLRRGQRGTVAVLLRDTGLAGAAGFSLTFDPAVLTFVSAAAGAGADGATLLTNDTQKVQGRVGLLIALPAGQTWTSGTRELVVLTFDAAAGSAAGTTSIGFGDTPIVREVADATAGVLGASYRAGSVALDTAAPSVLTHPTDQDVVAGATVTFTAAANGIPSPSVQWQVSTDAGTTFTNISGAVKTGHALVASAGDHGKRFRAVFTNSGGTASTTAAILTVRSAPSVTTHPADQIVPGGATAVFTAAAGGNPQPAVRWQISADGRNTWSDIAGATELTLTISAGVPNHGREYRAVFANSLGTAATSAARLSVRTPVLANPSQLRFSGVKEGSDGPLTKVTPQQAVTVAFAAASSPWTASSNQPWVEIVDGSGAGAGQFGVRIVNPGNVLGASREVTATVTVKPTVTGVTGATLTVSLALSPPGASGPSVPFGMVETPHQNARGLVGAVAVTGWALDDVGVSAVRLYRNCLSFEPAVNCQTLLGHSVVFIGDAAFLPGARPDVEEAFSALPAANRAGWGYLLLTAMLPDVTDGLTHGGDGPVSLYAFATDVEGNVTLLGRTQVSNEQTHIVLANKAIAKPFGAIDTPAQGETVSGLVNNFGWALTADANTTGGEAGDILIPTNGSTSFVFIDGAPVAPVNYNQCRGTVGNPVPAGIFCNDDVANIFGALTPQAALTTRTANPTKHRNLDAGRSAIGSYQIDTTKLANGLHTIAWSVTDSAGRTEGIGSRFFNVLNGGARTDGQLRAAPDAVVGDARALPAVSDGVIYGRSGFDLGADWQVLAADGEFTIPEVGRLELWLGADIVTGYLQVGDTLRPLPPGSRLDAGRFTWAPGAGYVGRYVLVFVGERGQVRLAVTIAGRAGG